MGKSCWQSLPAKFLEGSDSTSPTFKLQFSPLPDWYNGCRGGSHIVIRSKHRAGRAGRRSLDPGWHGGAFVLAACPSGPTMWDQIPPSHDQHGSVGWASPRKAKGGWFGSWSGHTPGLQSRSQLGVCERQHIDISLTHRCFSPCRSPSLPPLPKNK